MTWTEISRGVRSMTTSAVPSDSRTERVIASGCRASNSAATTFRTAEAVANGRRLRVRVCRKQARPDRINILPLMVLVLEKEHDFKETREKDPDNPGDSSRCDGRFRCRDWKSQTGLNLIRRDSEGSKGIAKSHQLSQEKAGRIRTIYRVMRYGNFPQQKKTRGVARK